MTNKDELFDIAPQENVGTEILDPNMPSNLDFELPEIQKNQKNNIELPSQTQPISTQQDNLLIKSFSLKGHADFSLPPKYPIDSIVPIQTSTFIVLDLSEEERSGGLWGIWESIVGYVKREMVIDDGFIYLLKRENKFLRVVRYWRLIDLFKVFVDPQDSQLRLVVQIEGSNQLSMRDFKTDQLNNIVARLRENAKTLGLTLVDY